MTTEHSVGDVVQMHTQADGRAWHIWQGHSDYITVNGGSLGIVVAKESTRANVIVMLSSGVIARIADSYLKVIAHTDYL